MTALYSIDELRAAHAAGHRIQANRGTDGAQRWVDLAEPEFTCPAHLYRIAPAADPRVQELVDAAYDFRGHTAADYGGKSGWAACERLDAALEAMPRAFTARSS